MFTLQNLSVSSHGKSLLTDINASLPDGKVTALIGPNGAGKTTLMRAMMGLLPALGDILWDGATLGDIPPDMRAKKLAYMPQGSRIHWPVQVENLVALGLYPRGMPQTQQARDKVDAMLERVGIARLKGRSTNTLSGGERALVLLARALMVEADGLLVDEPTASLDPRYQLKAMDLLAEEARRGRTVGVILHDLSLARRYSDHMLLLDKGRLIASGSCDQVLTSERLETIYGIRQTQQGFETVDS